VCTVWESHAVAQTCLCTVCESRNVAQTCPSVSSLCFRALPISVRPTIGCRRRLASLSVCLEISCWSAFRTGVCSSHCCGSCTDRVSAASCRALLWLTWSVESRGSRSWDCLFLCLPITTLRRRGCRFYTVGPITYFPAGGLHMKCYLSKTLLVTTSATAKRSSCPSRHQQKSSRRCDPRSNPDLMRHVWDNFHKHAVLITPSLERVVYHRNPRLENDWWQWSACELCKGTFRVPIQRQGRLPASGFGRMSLLHLHQAASVSERDGVGYSFSLRAESGEIQDGSACAPRRVEA